LATSDHAATGLPASYTFTAPNFGVHTFNVTFETAVMGTTVTANVGLTPTDTATLNVYLATVATHFAVYGGGGIFGATQNSPTPVTVVALNAANQPVTGYTGSVTFTSSDSGATISATKSGTPVTLSSFGSYQFQASDNGKHTFYVTFDMTMLQTLTATDSANSLTGTAQIWVSSFSVWWWGWW